MGGEVSHEFHANFANDSTISPPPPPQPPPSVLVFINIVSQKLIILHLNETDASNRTLWARGARVGAPLPSFE